MELPNSFLILSFLGLISLLKPSFHILHFFYSTFLRRPKDLKRAYGPWAVITGPTDGIGRAISAQLARHGLHLILVGRSPTKLKKTADVILEQFKDTQIRTVVWDLARESGGAERLRQAMAGVEVGVLVNSAGATYPCGAYFHDVEERVWREVVRVNVEGLSHVTQIVLTGMARRRRGAVVNIGSASSVAVPSFPFFAVYAATKAYINQFSRSLYVEYKKMGIDVQCQIPFYVATKMVSKLSINQTSTFIPSPENFAKASVRCIGYEPLCTPYWSHAIQWALLSLLPDFVLDAWRLRLGFQNRIQANKTTQ